MIAQRKLIDRLLQKLYRHVGPRIRIDILESLASDETNNFRMAEEFPMSLYLIHVLQQNRDYCLLWLIRRIRSGELGRILTFQELQDDHSRLCDRGILPHG